MELCASKGCGVRVKFVGVEAMVTCEYYRKPVGEEYWKVCKRVGVNRDVSLPESHSTAASVLALPLADLIRSNWMLALLPACSGRVSLGFF